MPLAIEVVRKSADVAAPFLVSQASDAALVRQQREFFQELDLVEMIATMLVRMVQQATSREAPKAISGGKDQSPAAS